jgi:transposase
VPIWRSNGLLKKRLRLARRDDIDLWSLDECHFQQHGSRATMWVPPEDKDPILLMAPTRKSVALFGAVNLRDGKLVTHFEKKFNAMTFRNFLIILLRHRRRTRKIAILLDNARYHHAAALRPLLKNHRDRLALEFLPAYSPELNPVERVWKLTRKLCTHNTYFEKLETLIDAVARQHEIWTVPNETLRKLCCII